jgi:hypothetical protein
VCVSIFSSQENDNQRTASYYLRGRLGSSNNFAQRLLAAEQFTQLASSFSSSSSSSTNSNSPNIIIQQTLDHLMAAQNNININDESNNSMENVVDHLKSAIANMHSFAIMMEETTDRRNLGETTLKQGPSIRATEFQTAATNLLAAAAVDNKNRESMEESMTTSHNVNIVKQGMKQALFNLQSTLEKLSSTPEEELQDLRRRLVVVARNHVVNGKTTTVAARMMMSVADNPAEAVPVVVHALARFLSNAGDAVAAAAADDRDADETDEMIALQDLLSLFWVMPVSVVAGTFFWIFAGLDTYRDIMSPLQIWIFEIVWVSRVLGCAIGNDYLCTAEDEDERSSITLPFLDKNQLGGPSL